MGGYLGNFLEHSGQLTSLAGVAVVWAGLALLGAAVVGRERAIEATPLYGWALASLLVTAWGTLTALPFTWAAIALAALAAAAGALAVRRRDPVLAPGTWRLLVLAAPLVVLVSAMVGSQSDEFSDWLISPRQMLALDVFPNRTNRHLGGSLTAYPYGWHLMTYLASRLAGRLVENAGALFNVLLLLAFAGLVARLVRDALGRGDAAGAPGWGLAALGVLAAAAAGVSQKVALTAYADTASGVATAFAAVLGWRMLNALAAGDRRAAAGLAWQVGLVLLVLVNLKQATLVLAVLVVGAVVLAGLRDGQVPAGGLVRALPAMVLPAAVVYVLWRAYVATELSGAETVIRPFDQWHTALIPEILWRMASVFAKKGVYLAVMAAAVVFAVRGLIRMRGPFDRLAVIAGALFLGYNAFLLFTYVAAFSKADGLRVASLWRYNMHLGPLAVAFAAHGLALLWNRARIADRPLVARLAWLPVVAALAAPFAFADKLRFDRHPPVPHFRAVGAAVAGLVGPGARLFVVDPTGSGDSAVIARFELGNRDVLKGYHGAYHPRTRARFHEIFFEEGFSHLLVHSTTPEMLDILGLALDARTSYLLVADGRGGWRIVGEWKRP